MLQPVAFEDLRDFIVHWIFKAQYQLNSGTWRDAQIVEKKVLSNGTSRISVQIRPNQAGTITGVRLIDCKSRVWAVKTMSIVCETAEEKMLQWFDFAITEVEEEES